MEIKMRISASVLCMLLSTAVSIHADEVSGVRFLQPRPLLKAYPSESLSTANRFEMQTVNKAPPNYPWPEGYGERPLVDVRLGMELPFLGGEYPRWAWYSGVPLSLEFLTDIFEGHTAPVVNTDYWFGMRLEALYRLNVKWPANIGVRILPFYHESTHIGDETALYTAEENDQDYYRINVSYEAWEFTLCLDEWEGGNENAFTIRLGASGRWNSDGYYNIPTDAEIGSLLVPGDIQPSRGNMEYFGQFHVVIPAGFPAIGNWRFQGGMELRNRILFDYFTDEDEQRAWTLISTIGWYRYPENWGGRMIGFHMRILTGQNPHGQFREQGGYFMFGTGFSLGI